MGGMIREGERAEGKGVRKEEDEEGRRRRVEATLEWLVRYFEYKHSNGGRRRWQLRFG